MLANGQADADIAAKLDVPVPVLEAALCGWREEVCPLRDVDDRTIEAFIEQDIKGFISLTMGRYPAEARREFSDQLLIELADVPYPMLRTAMAEARRKISFPERLVPFIFDFVEKRIDKLRAEGQRLEGLARIAHG